MVVTLPESHRDLFTRPIYAIFSSLLPDGQPQSMLVHVNVEENYLLVHMPPGPVQIDQPVAILVVDPQNSGRWIEVRGRVVGIPPASTGAALHRTVTASPVLAPIKIEPLKIALDAVF